MRSLRGVELTAMVMLTAIVTSAALPGDAFAGGYVAVDALCSIVLIGALAVAIRLAVGTATSAQRSARMRGERSTEFGRTASAATLRTS
jgi:hypothetical protein